MALMYYHKDVLKVIHYDESDILSLISSSVFLSFHFTSLYSIKKTHGTMLKMKKEHGLQNKKIKIYIEGLKTVLWITGEMM